MHRWYASFEPHTTCRQTQI